MAVEESSDEFEPLFDYSGVQPIDPIYTDDEFSDSSPVPEQKRQKISKSTNLEEKEKVGLLTALDDEDKVEDWLPPPPPKITNASRVFLGDSAIQELRLMKQELMSFAKSAENILKSLEEYNRQDPKELESDAPGAENIQLSNTQVERVKIIISIQDKDGPKQFRMHMDDKFEKLFKMYAEKVSKKPEDLVFCFDGEKVSPSLTPTGLGLEDNDMIEVHLKSR